MNYSCVTLSFIHYCLLCWWHSKFLIQDLFLSTTFYAQGPDVIRTWLMLSILILLPNYSKKVVEPKVPAISLTLIIPALFPPHKSPTSTNHHVLIFSSQIYPDFYFTPPTLTPHINCFPFYILAYCKCILPTNALLWENTG